MFSILAVCCTLNKVLTWTTSKTQAGRRFPSPDSKAGSIEESKGDQRRDAAELNKTHGGEIPPEQLKLEILQLHKKR